MKFYGELLVLFLLLITNLRVFFVNHVRRDPLTVLAPFTFALTILQIFAWGVDVFTILDAFIGLLVFLSNFHAMFRYYEQLYVDHYSVLMKVWAVLTVILTIIILAFTIMFAPVEQKNQKIGVTETLTRYKGNFRSGFEKASSVSYASALIYEFSASAPLGGETPEPEAIVLVIPDKRGDTTNYKPYLQMLTQAGYTVYSADIFADDVKWMHTIEDHKPLRRICSVIRSLWKNQWYLAQKEFYNYNISKELSVLIPMIKNNYPSKDLYVVYDVMGDTAISDYKKSNPDTIKDYFSLSSIDDYKTAGYGCVEQTDPLLAAVLGYSRDSKLQTPKLLAEKTVDFISNHKEDKNDIIPAEPVL